ncbi:MAG: hypothetical protein MJ112_08025 [Lachnospiraceae bacterium]|nr:hypothetical protein [Lachnospiraceae bacterium]
MAGFLEGLFKNKELEGIIFKLEANMSNNYKDNAQDNLKELEKKFEELIAEGKLSTKKTDIYKKLIEDYKVRMKDFTHKDQKPYWTK